MGMKSLGIALVAMALGAVTVAPAGAAQDGNKIIEIRSVLYGECLGATGPGPGSTTILPCDGSAAQQWELVPVGGGRNLVRNIAIRDCLSERYGFSYCDDEDPAGFAAVQPDASGATRVAFGDNGAFLRALTWSSGERDVLIVTWGEPAEQRWELRTVGTRQPLPDTAGQVVRIRSAEERSGCLALAGTKLVPTPCADTPAQKFQRIEVNGGRTAFRSIANSKCVSLRDREAIEPEVTAECAAGEAGQHWSIEPTRLGSARLRNALNPDEFVTPGAGWVFMTTHFGNTWQQWELVPA
ncbi:RICIN domain-containing protein [Lentzea sp. CA-135723]|uniref:RICIN domain-containing protein n=1 Tax=Lentzea sp. CA-135723 TaxID=3239950 RepID=UPI003D930D78